MQPPISVRDLAKKKTFHSLGDIFGSRRGGASATSGESTAVQPLLTSQEKAVVKFTFEKAIDATRHNPNVDSSFVELFPMYEKRLQEILGSEVTPPKKLKFMETNLADNPFPAPDEPIEKGNVKFNNYYGDGFLVLASNFKDKNLADFYASDVIQMQAEKAGFHGPLECIVVKDIISTSGKKFFEDNELQDMAYMTAGQIKDFLSQVSPTTSYLMSSFGTEPKSAQVLTQPGVPAVVILLEDRPQAAK